MGSIFADNLKRINKIKDAAGLSSNDIKLISAHKKINKDILHVNGKEYEAWRILGLAKKKK